MKGSEGSSVDVQHALDREVELVMSAIDLVAGQGAPSATVGGLRMTDLVIEIVRPLAAQRGVVVEPLWGADETTTDVRVRPAGS
jgi:hypothetical protein